MARTTPRSVSSGRGRTISQRRRMWPLLIGGLAVLALGGWYALSSAQGSVELLHIHGMGYAPDEHQLFVAAHDGFRIFTDGAWRIPDLPAHDYMGYGATDDGFYSSGHPAPGSGLVNPLGLVKSTDGGKTLTKLALEGESDFHLMGVGYQNHAIYVLNPAPNSRLSAGMHYSLDNGKTWQQSAMQGVTAQLIQLAVHPTEANIVALATEEGLFISANHGDTFERIGSAGPVTAVSFSPDGAGLFFGYNTLYRYEQASKALHAVQTPGISADDAIGYIAVNPAQPDEIAFATLRGDMYLSPDSGQSWQQIAQDGTGR
jgi:hypothetical protein